MKCRLCPITSLLIEFQPLCQDLCKILISRIMEELGLKMGQDYPRYNYVWSVQYLDMIKLWCTQDPYIDQYARFLHG